MGEVSGDVQRHQIAPLLKGCANARKRELRGNGFNAVVELRRRPKEEKWAIAVKRISERILIFIPCYVPNLSSILFPPQFSNSSIWSRVTHLTFLLYAHKPLPLQVLEQPTNANHVEFDPHWIYHIQFSTATVFNRKYYYAGFGVSLPSSVHAHMRNAVMQNGRMLIHINSVQSSLNHESEVSISWSLGIRR